ncbi:MAG TPA: hypothetical protein VGN26_02845 [Armatimonadota bacterium]
MAGDIVLGPPESLDLRTPTPEELTHGARWQVENLDLPMALRALCNVMGIDLGKKVENDWSTDYTYVLSAAACGDLFTFGLALYPGHQPPPPPHWRQPGEHAAAARRGFASVGCEAELLVRGTDSWPARQQAAEAVAGCIASGMPALLIGAPLPGHLAVVTGYAQHGALLHGWTCEAGGAAILFEPDARRELADWLETTEVIALCRDSKAGRDERRIYRQAITQAVELLERNQDGPALAGQALYEAWAAAFVGASSPEGIARLSDLIHPWVWDLAERRHYAREFLQRAAGLLPDQAEDLAAASGEFGALHDLMWKLFRAAGGNWPCDPTPGLAEKPVRDAVAAHIAEAAALDRRARAHLQKAVAGFSQ